MKYIHLKIAIILFLFSFSVVGQKLQMQKIKILIIADASQSMVEKWDERTKIDAVRLYLSGFIEKMSNYGEVEFAYRVFGADFESHENNCSDSKLVIPFSSLNGDKIKVALNQTSPSGISALSYALENSLSDFENETFHKKYIILITDGPDACNKSICASYNTLKSNPNITDVFCIGINLSDSEANQFKCFTNFINSSTEKSFKNECDKIFSKIKPY